MAPAAKKPPLRSSSSHNSAGKTIEKVYQKKTLLEHILLRPDTYVGSVQNHTQTLWVYEDGAMVNRSVSYVPGLYKIFDEILVNAADNKQRDPSMDSLKVDIDVEGCCISIYNNGDGVPVEIHQEERVYVPELIFGHLLTSSNYNDNERKTTGGRNGYGAKLANIFSTEFVIETADGHRLKRYRQVFSENMGKKSDPEIKKCNKSENWTRVTFKPDLAKFNMTELEADVVALMRKRVVDMAGTLGKTVKVELNGEKVAVKSLLDGSDDDDYEAEILKPAAQKKKPPPKKASAPVKAEVKDEEDDGDVADLKDRLAAYSINDTSPEPSAMETEEKKVEKGRNGPGKRGAEAMSSLADISDEDVAEPHHESEDGVSSKEVEKKTKGRKPAAEKPKTTIRKRSPAQSKGMRQKVMEGTFKPTDDSNLSAPPEKKVRVQRIRNSPFNKKSGSVLHRMASSSTGTEDVEAPPSGSSAEPVAPRRTTRNRKAAVVYVAFGSEDDESEDEEVSEPSDDDDFSEYAEASGSEDDESEDEYVSEPSDDDDFSEDASGSEDDESEDEDVLEPSNDDDFSEDASGSEDDESEDEDVSEPSDDDDFSEDD